MASARPQPDSVYRISVDPASTRQQQVEFLLRVVEAKSEVGDVQFQRAPEESADLVIRDIAVSTELGDRRRLVIARGSHSPASICATPVAIAEPLNLRSIIAALQAAVGSASDGFEPVVSGTDTAPQRAHRVLDRWVRRATPMLDLHLVGDDGSVVLALLSDGRSRLGLPFASLADAMRANWEFRGDGTALTAAALLAESQESSLTQTLWEIGQLASTASWVGGLGPDATIELRFWPFQAADGPPAASQVLRRLRRGPARVDELLALASNGRDDVVRVLNACLAIEAVALVGRAAAGPDGNAADAIPVVVLGPTPTRLHRMLASIRRVLAID